MALIERDIDLRPFNSFGLQCMAREFCAPADLAAIQQLIARGWWAEPSSALWLGGGSNVLLLNASVQRVVVPRLLGRHIIALNANEAIVEVAASERWHDVVLWTLTQGWAGLENLALIPGSVGAAPIQNIGAYGVELAQVLDSVQVIDVDTGQLADLQAGQCALGYRDSLFKHPEGSRWRVLSVRMKLHRQRPPKADYRDLAQELHEQGIDNPSPMQVARAVMAVRQRKLPDPTVLGNAGSFFKNPVIPRAQAESMTLQWPGLPVFTSSHAEHAKISAAWMIEQCGWKGRRHGDAGVHAHHALVLVNHGKATGRELWELACAIQSSVKERFGIHLEPEPVLVGQPEPL
jgi:UDP-N-acetylmuramate dehydrogenase